MNDVVIITAPDIVLNDAFTLCLIGINDNLKITLHDILLKSTEHANVYWYNNSVNEIEWLLTVVKMSTVVLIDVDHCDHITKQFASHIIAQPNCFYLTNDNSIPYNLLNKNRVYDLVWLQNILNRGKNEQTFTE